MWSMHIIREKKTLNKQLIKNCDLDKPGLQEP